MCLANVDKNIRCISPKMKKNAKSFIRDPSFLSHQLVHSIAILTKYYIIIYYIIWNVVVEIQNDPKIPKMWGTIWDKCGENDSQWYALILIF